LCRNHRMHGRAACISCPVPLEPRRLRRLHRFRVVCIAFAAPLATSFCAAPLASLTSESLASLAPLASLPPPRSRRSGRRTKPGVGVGERGGGSGGGGVHPPCPAPPQPGLAVPLGGPRLRQNHGTVDSKPWLSRAQVARPAPSRIRVGRWPTPSSAQGHKAWPGPSAIGSTKQSIDPAHQEKFSMVALIWLLSWCWCSTERRSSRQQRSRHQYRQKFQ
jgi:hypothetical protein